MSDNLFLIVTICASGALGAYLGSLFTKLSQKSTQGAQIERENQMTNIIDDLNRQIEKTDIEQNELRNDKNRINQELIAKNIECINLEKINLTREAELEKRQEQLRKDFEILATKILDEKSEKFTLQNKENIKQILNPLQDKIQLFEKKVEDTQIRSVKMHSALEEQLKGLKDLNQQMTKEATNLTKALKGDSKMQGNWGELVLERVRKIRVRKRP